MATTFPQESKHSKTQLVWFVILKQDKTQKTM